LITDTKIVAVIFALALATFGAQPAAASDLVAPAAELTAADLEQAKVSVARCNNLWCDDTPPDCSELYPLPSGSNCYYVGTCAS
jgi:hypothetical protein